VVNLDISRLENSEIYSTGITLPASVPVEDHTPDLDHRNEVRTCTRRGCRKLALDDAEYCAKHDADIRKYKRDYDRRRRAEWEAAKRCMRCGAEKRKAGRPWCPACVIRLDTARKGVRADHTSDLDHSPRNPKRERIAQRLIPWSNSPLNEGRIRMRGGKRGAPSLESRDRRDLADIQRILVRYEQTLDEAYSQETREMTPDQRASTRRAAHAGLALAVRLGMEALVTYGYEVPVLARDDDDEIGDPEE
jgi:hypothetical protein